MSALAACMSAPLSTLIKPDAKVITVSAHDEPIKAFMKLLDHHILSAPCQDDEGHYIGFLDLRDLVSLICFQNEQDKIHDEEEKLKHGMHMKGDRGHAAFLNILLSKANITAVKMFDNPMEGFMCSYMARRNPFTTCLPTDPISKAFEKLKVQRRICVVNDNGDLLDVISQSNIISFLYEHANELGEILNTPLTTLGIGPVISVKSTSLANVVFAKMNTHQIRGLAVVDETGKLVGNTSASDLKFCVKHSTFAMLRTTPIFQYLNNIRRQDINENCPTVAVNETDSIGLAIGKLAATKMHRVFIVDNSANYHPLRVLSLTDIIKHLAKQLHD